MNIEFYLLFLLSIFANFVFGFLLTRRVLYALPVGLFFCASLIAILTRIVPSLTLEIIAALLIIGLLIFIYKKYYLDILKKYDKKFVSSFIISFLIFLIFFIKFHYQFIVYQSHESFYFAPAIELYLAEYNGNIRGTTYFPSGLTGHPIFPSSLLSASTVFVNELNLVKVLEARYIIIVIFFSLIVSSFNYLKIGLLKTLIIFITSLYFYENLISHSLMHSDVTGLFCFAFLLISLITNKNDDLIKISTYLSLFLLITKPGIIFIFLIFPLYFFLKYNYVRKDLVFYLISFIIFLNGLSWIALEAPFGNSSISLFNPFNLVDYFYTLTTANWFNDSMFFSFVKNFFNLNVFIFPDEISNLNHFQKVEIIKLNLLKIIIDAMELLFYFLIIFILSFILIYKSETTYQNKQLLSIFLLLSFLVFVFLRNENIFGNKTTEQVVHIFYFLSIIPLILIPIFFSYKKNYKFLPLFIILFTLNANFDLIYGKNEFQNRISSKEFIVYKNINFDSNQNKEKFYKL